MLTCVCNAQIKGVEGGTALLVEAGFERHKPDVQYPAGSLLMPLPLDRDFLEMALDASASLLLTAKLMADTTR